MLLQLGPTRLLTDPVLRSRVAHLRRVGSATDVPADIDGVLISHAHHDHLDPASLRLLGRETTIVLPQGAGRLLRRRGFRNLTELRVGEETEIGGVTIRATHAEHRPGRGPLAARSPTLGYLVGRGPDDPEHWRAYFAGDTDLFDAMAGLTHQLDVALLPVAGWGKRVGAGHLDPERAAEAVRRLEPDLAIPIHWGTLSPWRALREPDRSPALEFARRVAESGVRTHAEILDPGTSRAL